MDNQPAAATVEDLTQRCGHECLSRPDHDGTHFYGYKLGPYSYEGLLRRVTELEAALDSETFVTEALSERLDSVEDAVLGQRLRWWSPRATLKLWRLVAVR